MYFAMELQVLRHLWMKLYLPYMHSLIIDGRSNDLTSLRRVSFLKFRTLANTLKNLWQKTNTRSLDFRVMGQEFFLSWKCSHAECFYGKCHYAKCHYVECLYAECLGAALFVNGKNNSLILLFLTIDI